MTPDRKSGARCRRGRGRKIKWRRIERRGHGSGDGGKGNGCVFDARRKGQGARLSKPTATFNRIFGLPVQKRRPTGTRSADGPCFFNQFPPRAARFRFPRPFFSSPHGRETVPVLNSTSFPSALFSGMIYLRSVWSDAYFSKSVTPFFELRIRIRRNRS